MSFTYLKAMPTPEEIRQRLPLSTEGIAIKKKRDQEVNDIISGKDDRFLAIIGPCSADNEDSVLEYISRLKTVADQISDKVLVVPRIYTRLFLTS